MIAIGYLAAFLVGIVLGLLGGGGSILTVPLLVYLFKIPASLATAYSLFLVGISSAVGAIAYLRNRLVDFKTGLFFLLPSMAGVALSRRVLLPAVPIEFRDQSILISFALVMTLAALSMIRGRKQSSANTENASPPHFKIALLGAFAGMVMGFVGAGGGFLIIPVLVLLGSMDMKRAVATSLFIITVNSLFGFFSDLLAGIEMRWVLLTSLAALSIAGVLVGTQLNKKISSSQLKTSFGYLVLLIAAFIFTKELVLNR